MKYISFIIILFVFLGCGGKPIVERSDKSQLAIREMQSKIVNSQNIKYISRVIVQVLQDDEFVIDNLDSGLGYFKASKTLDGGKEKYNFSLLDIYYPVAIYKATTLGRNILKIEATISIRIQKDNSKIRASFVSTLVDEDGKTQSIKTIDDPKFYQKFFSKISKGLFLEKQNL